MNKVAYEQGVWLALMDAGIVKKASHNITTSKVLEHLGVIKEAAGPSSIAKAMEFLAAQGGKIKGFAGANKAPLIGAAAGGVAGGVGGGDLESALMGAGAGGLLGATGGGQLKKLLDRPGLRDLIGKGREAVSPMARKAKGQLKDVQRAASERAVGTVGLSPTRGAAQAVEGARNELMASGRLSNDVQRALKAQRGHWGETITPQMIQGLGYGGGGALGLAALSGDGE